jgi:lantibiotic biosynthesis protein
MGWTPLLTGAEAKRAARAVDAVAGEMRGLPLVGGPRAFKLMDGQLGRAIFLAYHARWRGDDRSAAAADALLGQAIEGAAACEEPSFYGGLAGMAWAIEHAEDMLGGGEDDEPDDGPAAALDEILAARPDSIEVEWLSGLAGWAVYGLARPRSPVRAALLARIVDALAARAEAAPGGGLRWRCPDWMPLAQDRARFPDGCFPLDPAHGAMGPIGVLAGCAAAGIAVDRARPLVDAAVGWLLDQRMEGGGSLFPRCAGEREGGLGWCAGDPGVAAVLHAAGVALDRPDWRDAALEAARRAARGFEAAGGMEAGLCHGAAGLGHIAGRLAHASGDQELARASRRALGAALEAPVGGDASLLTGRAGVGLALLSAVSEIEPAWDRALLVSL